MLGAMKRSTALWLLYFVLAECVLVGLLLLNLSQPICSLSVSTERILNGASVASILIFVGGLIVAWSTRAKSERWRILVVFAFFFSSAPLFWSAMDRKAEFDEQNWKFSGIVQAKYVSENHGAKSVMVGGVKYEGLPGNVWKLISVGQHVSKARSSASIMVGNQELYMPKPSSFRNILKAWLGY